MQLNSPYLVMRDTIISMVGDFNNADRPMLPERSGDLYENVTKCWLGSEAYPGNTPAGVTVHTGATAQTLIDDALAEGSARRHRLRRRRHVAAAGAVRLPCGGHPVAPCPW